MVFVDILVPAVHRLLAITAEPFSPASARAYFTEGLNFLNGKHFLLLELVIICFLSALIFSSTVEPTLWETALCMMSVELTLPNIFTSGMLSVSNSH